MDVGLVAVQDDEEATEEKEAGVDVWTIEGGEQVDKEDDAETGRVPSVCPANFPGPHCLNVLIGMHCPNLGQEVLAKRSSLGGDASREGGVGVYLSAGRRTRGLARRGPTS